MIFCNMIETITGLHVKDVKDTSGTKNKKMDKWPLSIVNKETVNDIALLN